MRIILLSFLVLFNYTSLVTSCPSSGDGDCVPSTDTYNQGANQSSFQTVTEIPSMNTPSSYSIDDSDSGLPDDYIVKSSSYLNEINKKSKLNAKIKRLNFDLKNIIYSDLTNKTDLTNGDKVYVSFKDYKYQDASKKIKSIDKNKIDKAIRYTHKIEKSINKFGYEIENAKRYLVSIKKLLEF